MNIGVIREKIKFPIIEKFQLNGFEKEESISVRKGSECFYI